MINFDQVYKSIFVGTAPQNPIDVRRLISLKINSVISLQSDDDIKLHRINWPELSETYQSVGIQVYRHPIRDFDQDDLANNLIEPVRTLHKTVQLDHRIYVHCNAGICRAPATVLAYLVHYQDMSFSEALAVIRAQRPHVNPYKDAVLNALEKMRSKN